MTVRVWALVAVMLLVLAGCGVTKQVSDNVDTLFSDNDDTLVYGGPIGKDGAPVGELLPGPRIAAMLAGNTLVGVRPANHFIYYLRPDGYMRAYVFKAKPAKDAREWRFVRAVWRISDDGHFCLRWEDRQGEDCVWVRQAGEVLHGQSAPNATWRFSAEIRPGNPFHLD